MADGNTLATAPEFHTHRDAVSVADTLPITEEPRGVNSKEYAEILANLMCDAGVPGETAVFEVLFWSPLAGAYVSESTPTTYTVPQGTAVAIRFTANGRKFFIAVTTLSAGRKASAEVAAFWIDPRYD